MGAAINKVVKAAVVCVHGEALVIKWKAIACRLLLCEFSG
jgi:hypothetical protein